MALKRLGVLAVAAVTVFGVTPALTAPASANHTTTAVSLSPDAQSSPVGTCQQYTATVTFNNTNGTDTATVDVLADPRVSEDVNFCSLNTTGSPANTTSTTPPANGNVITTGGAGVSENAEYVVTSANGSTTASVTFGVVVTNNAGTVDVTAFLENTATSSGNGTPDGAELRDTSVATFTTGGAAGVASVDAEPETGAAVQGQPYQFTATVKNSSGQPIAGVTPRFDVTAGPDVALGPFNCDAPTNQLGQTTCTLVGGGSTPGQDTIRVFVDQVNADGNPLTADTTGPDAGEPNDDITVTFGAPQAAGTTVTLTCATVRTNNAGTTCQNPITENSEVFTALVRNSSGTALSGVPVTFTFVEGGTTDANNVPAGTNDTETLTPTNCTTGADGTCTTTLSNPRVTEGETFTVTARVGVSSGSGNCPADTNGVCATSTKTFATAAANTARIVTLTPETQSVAAGGVGAVVATVTDRRGIVVPGVTVTFTEVGTGRFTNGSDTFTGVTNSNGQVRAELNTTSGETAGSTTVTAEITSNRTAGANNDVCENTANNSGNSTTNNDPGAPAGACTDTSTVTFGGASPTPTATGTGTPSPGTCSNNPTVSLSPSIITATGASTVTVRATPNSIVDLFAYTRPSTTYTVVRSSPVPASGQVTFTVTPPRNTRLYAQERGCSAGGSVVLNVRTALSLAVTRTGTRQYRFSGDSLPARPGGLIVSLYRIDSAGTQILTAQVRANSTTGDWVINRTFTGTGRFNFIVRTGADLQNAPGQSNVRNLLVF